MLIVYCYTTFFILFDFLSNSCGQNRINDWSEDNAMDTNTLQRLTNSYTCYFYVAWNYV